MARRPSFLNVRYSGTDLNKMDYEKRIMKEKDVEFDDEDGSIELTDVRLVWIKKPSRWGGLKKAGGIAGAIAGAVAADAIGSSIGGGAGRAIRRAGRGLAYASIGAAISSWSRDSYINKDKDGNTETVALPILAISQAAQSGNKLVLQLKSGGNMQFRFKQKKVIPSVIANITSAMDEGKCPYCGAGTSGANKCSNCGAVLAGGGESPSSGGDGRFCTKCGHPIEDGDRFCGKCGNPV